MNVEYFNKGKSYILEAYRNNTYRNLRLPIITSFTDEEDWWFQQGIIEALEKLGM